MFQKGFREAFRMILGGFHGHFKDFQGSSRMFQGISGGFQSQFWEILGVSKICCQKHFRGFQGVSQWLQGVLKGYVRDVSGSSKVPKSLMCIHRFSGLFQGSQEVFIGVLGGSRGFRGARRAPGGLMGVSWGFQGVPRAFQEVQGVFWITLQRVQEHFRGSYRRFKKSDRHSKSY